MWKYSVVKKDVYLYESGDEWHATSSYLLDGECQFVPRLELEVKTHLLCVVTQYLLVPIFGNDSK